MLPFVVAHQGGWDEFLIFAVPVAIGLWALRFVEKKSRQRAEAKRRTENDRNRGGCSPRCFPARH